MRKKWSPEAMEALRGALNTIDWNALYEPHGEEIDGIVDWLSEYIKFCMVLHATLFPIKWSTVTQTTHPR